MKTVDTGFSLYHTDLMQLRTDKKGDAGKTIVENADKLLKQLRQDAVKAIHAAVTCAKQKDDQDEQDQKSNDENDDQKGQSSTRHAEGNLLVVFFNNLFGKNGTQTVTTSASPTPTLAPATPSTTTTVTSGDVQKIADDAVAAMKLAFDTAKSDLDALTSNSTTTPKPNRSPEHSDKSKSGKSSDNKDEQDDD